MRDFTAMFNRRHPAVLLLVRNTKATDQGLVRSI